MGGQFRPLKVDTVSSRNGLSMLFEMVFMSLHHPHTHGFNLRACTTASFGRATRKSSGKLNKHWITYGRSLLRIFSGVIFPRACQAPIHVTTTLFLDVVE